MAINTVALSGNLTREPSLTRGSSGTAILRFTLAQSYFRRDPLTGEGADEPQYFDVTVLGRRGEGLAPILKKGTLVTVQGRLSWSSWTASDGTRRSKVEVVATEVQLPPRAPGEARCMSPEEFARGVAEATSGNEPLGEQAIYDSDREW